MADISPTDARLARRARLAAQVPFLVLLPSLVATLVYVLGFSLWTFWLSLSQSTLLPNPAFQGFDHYVALFEHSRWRIAYTNLFLFGSLYVAGSLVLGTALAILIDQKARGESIWRSIYLYPLAISFVVTGTVWRWILNPTTGVETLLRDLGWAEASFDWIIDRDMAIYTVVIVGIWHASGFAMALILAGLRSVDPDLVRAARIDGASAGRIYARVILPTIRPIFVAVLVVLLQFAIKTFDLVVALTSGGPGLATNVPAIYVYDMMFQRGQIAQGAAAAILILLALVAVLVPYFLYLAWVRRREGGGEHG